MKRESKAGSMPRWRQGISILLRLQKKAGGCIFSALKLGARLGYKSIICNKTPWLNFNRRARIFGC